MKKLRKYLPIRIFSIKFAYGWWFGKYFFFFGKHSTCFGILPMYFHHSSCTYANGTGIEDGECFSWSDSRQKEYREDKERRNPR